MEYLFWALVGWCGTPPRPWPWPDPDPDPWISKIIGVVGGVAGGWAFSQAFGVDVMTAVNVAASSVGAWGGAVLLGNVYGLVKGHG